MTCRTLAQPNPGPGAPRPCRTLAQPNPGPGAPRPRRTPAPAHRAGTMSLASAGYFDAAMVGMCSTSRARRLGTAHFPLSCLTLAVSSH